MIDLQNQYEKTKNEMLEENIIKFIYNKALEDEDKTILNNYPLEENDFTTIFGKDFCKIMKKHGSLHPSYIIEEGLELPELDEMDMYSFYPFDNRYKELKQLTIKRKLFDTLEKGIKKLDLDDLKNQLNNIDITINNSIPEIKLDTYFNKKEKTIVNTGYKDIDEGAGLERGYLVTIGARPSIGKTALMVNLLHNMVKNKHKVILFTLEMETERILDRLFAIITKTENTFFKYKNISKENKYKCESYIAEHKDYIKIVDKSNLSEDEIIRICRQEKNKNGLDVVLLDYLGLVNGTSKENRNLTLSAITRKFKVFAKDDSVLFIQASQLNRGNAKENRIPVLEDLRDSGSIEQDSDVVMLMHRKDRNSEDLNLIIAKNRYGNVGTVYLDFELKTSTIENGVCKPSKST